MSQDKYIGVDVHQATISAAVRDAQGKLTTECLLETKAATTVEFIEGLRGTLALTFEEGTLTAWLHDLLKTPREPAGIPSTVFSHSDLELVPQRKLHYARARKQPAVVAECLALIDSVRN